MTGNLASEVLDDVPDGFFIAGRWVPAAGRRTLDVYDPSTGERIKTIADASPEDGMKALDAAAAGAAGWAATPARQRGELLRRAFDLLQERKEDFALLMTPGVRRARLASGPGAGRVVGVDRGAGGGAARGALR